MGIQMTNTSSTRNQKTEWRRATSAPEVTETAIAETARQLLSLVEPEFREDFLQFVVTNEIPSAAFQAYFEDSVPCQREMEYIMAIESARLNVILNSVPPNHSVEKNSASRACDDEHAQLADRDNGDLSKTEK